MPTYQDFNNSLVTMERQLVTALPYEHICNLVSSTVLSLRSFPELRSHTQVTPFRCKADDPLES